MLLGPFRLSLSNPNYTLFGVSWRDVFFLGLGEISEVFCETCCFIHHLAGECLSVVRFLDERPPSSFLLFLLLPAKHHLPAPERSETRRTSSGTSLASW